MSNIFVYPSLVESKELSNIVCRLAWYFKPYLDSINAIYIISTRNMFDNITLAPMLDPLISQNLDSIKTKIQLKELSEFCDAISCYDPVRDILLIWDETSEKGAPTPIQTAIKTSISKKGLYRVDPIRTRMEGSFYLWAGLNRYADQKALIDQNHARMREMVNEIGFNEKAYVFGSGPSLSEFVARHDFSDGVCVISNSIVKNRDIIAATRPRVITAADPLYHAGCSSYAGAFRNELIHALRETDAWFVCPLRDFAIYDTFLPADLRMRIIGVPFNKDAPPPTNLAETFYLKPYPNVLTLGLLPIASTLGRKIEIVACDGRPLTDDGFFWSHDKKAQFNDKMSDIQSAHPAFFAIDYNDYYTDHCRNVEEVLSALEGSGKRIETVTPSLIPALHARERLATGTDSIKRKAAVFAMVDPDAKDDWGHFLAYDKRIAEGCHQLVPEFALICRKDLAPKFIPARVDLVMPVLSIHSWSIGNKWPNVQREHILQFTRELEEAFATLETRYPEGDVVVFMYVGSIEVAEIIEYLLIPKPRFKAVINLFWSYNFVQNQTAYRAFWRPVLKRLERSSQVTVFHGTPQIAKEFREEWDIDLPVLPHPSTTFSDGEAITLSKLPDAIQGFPASVLFPGGMRKEKGFLLSLGACAELADSAEFRCTLRARIDAVAGRELETALATLVSEKGDKVDILNANLSDEEFVEMLKAADILVIPYLSEAFRRRTSGILIDSLLLGKPVVVLKDTWLSDLVNSNNIGISASPDPRSIALAVRAVAARYATFLPGIRKARNAYLRKHSWAALVKNVLARAGLVTPVVLTPDSFAQANCLYREGNFAEALRIYEALIAREPLSIYRTNAEMAIKQMEQMIQVKNSEIICK